ncbi:MAG: transcription factor FapR [bacterium]
MKQISKKERQSRLQELLLENPFSTDEDLAQIFKVSVQTVRLDRLALSIPELRERTKQMAEQTYSRIKSLASEDIVGEILDLELNTRGLSMLETTPDMCFARSNIVKTHYIFSQASMLAVAIIDADVVLTGLANIKFKRPVRAGEKLVAKAEILRRIRNNFVVAVVTRVEQEQVFRGKFVVFVQGCQKPGGTMD